MSKRSTQTFVHELPLGTTPQEERELDIRLEASRNLYNACLRHCLKQIAFIRQSRSWRKARGLSRSEHSKERKELFKQAKKQLSERWHYYEFQKCG